MRSRYLRATGFAAAAWLLIGSVALASPRAAAQPATGQEPAPRACKVLHVHIRGDLDSMRLAQDFADVLAAGRTDGVEVILLELSGDRWRADVVHAMAKAMRVGTSPGSPAGATPLGGQRILAFLEDERDRRIGFGQTALAVLADGCALSPRATLRFEGTDDLRATAPPDTDWERVDRELQGLVYLAARDRQADVLLSSILPLPSGPMWAMPGSAAAQPWRLTSNRPEGASGTLVVPAAPEGRLPSVSLDYMTASRLGIVTCQAKDAGQLLADQGLRARPIVRKELVSGLELARSRINRLVGQLDDAIRAIDIELAQGMKLRGQDSSRRKRETGARAEASILEASRYMLDAESLMAEYPELLAGLPPGRTPVGQEPEKHPTLWRWRFQDFRDELARLRGEAEALSRTP